MKQFLSPIYVKCRFIHKCVYIRDMILQQNILTIIGLLALLIIENVLCMRFSWSVLLITTWSYQSFFFFVNSTELCFELQSTNDGGMDAIEQSDAFISCDNHNGTIASGKVTSLLFQILLYTC